METGGCLFRLLKAPKSRRARPGPLLFAQHSFAIGSTMQNNDFSFLLSAQKHTDSTKKKKNGYDGSDRICILHRGQRADLACRTGMVVRKNRTHWSHRGGKTQLSTRFDGSHENFHLSCLSSRLVSLQEEHDKRRVSVQVGISNCDGGVWWKRLEEKKIRQTDRHTDRGGWLIYMDGF